MKYLIYTLSNSGEGIRVIVEDENNVCDGYEEIVRRYFSQEAALTLNLSPKLAPETVELALFQEGFSRISYDWVETGVPDILVIDRSGEKRFIEVKTAGDGLSENQIEWARKYDFDQSIAYVVEVESSVDSDLQIGNEDLFRIDESLRGREDLIELCYEDVSSHKYAEEIRAALDVLSEKRLVEETHLEQTVGLKSVSGSKQLDEILRPLMEHSDLKHPPVMRYRVGSEVYYYLTSVGIKVRGSNLDREVMNRIKEFVGEYKSLSSVKERREITGELILDIW
ncbi:VRR-NUC domain-containing protein [Natrinema altunense]|uniref:VRR-NUC domain-containing protein n=1 Tax=Natrinema altunense TaxID=222984 RepID=UPI00135F173B|nr:VRR-NUC domain-containing protein [Natrinema altunense]